MTAQFYGYDYQPGMSAPDPAAIAEALSILKPKPSPRPLVRIGGTADGAYLLPDDLDGIAACFSPGVNNFKHFEDELAARYGIPSHMCDFTSDADQFATPLIEGMQTFAKAWLDLPGVPDSLQLADWVGTLCPDPAHDLMLQIDIEGAEYRNLLACPDAVLRRFRIIVLELHKLRAIANPDLLAQIVSPFLRKLDRDFVCVHVHPNNCGGAFELPEWGVMPNLIEMTLLRRDRFVGATERFEPASPHPLDIGSNVPHREPMFLSDTWLDAGRSARSAALMTADRLTYKHWQIKQLGGKIAALRDHDEAALRKLGAKIVAAVDEADALRRALVHAHDLA